MRRASRVVSQSLMKLAKDPAWLALVGNRIVILREIKRVKQVELANALGISVGRLSNYERGRRPVDIETAIALCRKLDSTLDYLYTGNTRGLPFHVGERLAQQEGRLHLPGGEDGPGFKN